MKKHNVGLFVGDSNDVSTFVSVADAINSTDSVNPGIKEREKTAPGQNYRITFFGDNYAFTADDSAAILSMQDSQVGTVTWTSKTDANGNTMQSAKTVYAANNDISFFGAKTVIKDIKFDAKKDINVYAEGKPIELLEGVETEGPGVINLYGGSKLKETTSDTSILVKSGNLGNIYGGGLKAHTGNTSIDLKGGNAKNVYGGGSGATGSVTGNTSVTVDGIQITGGGIYGGGEGTGATVGGTATVTYVNQNATEHKTDTLKALSGSGTDDAGNLVANVTGKKAIILKGQSRTYTGGLVVTDLAGFDTLDIGETPGTDISYEKALLIVTRRFDSEAVDPVDITKERTGLVTLHKATLFMGSATQGHIGQLKVDGVSALVVFRDGNDTVPLKVDSNSNDIQKSAKLRLGALKTYDIQTHSYSMENKVGDRIIQFTKTGVAADEYAKYEDSLSTRLSVEQETVGNDVFIKFATPISHIASGWVEYKDNTPDSLTTEDATSSTGKTKTLHINYDKENKHEVRTAQPGGYIVALPKNKVNEAEAKNYTVIDEEFRTNGTCSTAVAALNPVYVTFTIDQNTAGQHGAHAAEGIANITDLDPVSNWYILHIVCEHGDPMTTVLDLDAPLKAEDAVKVDYDSDSDSYIYELRLKDRNYEDRTKLPTTKPGEADANENRLSYAANGVKAGYWAFGALDGTGMTTPETEVVKQKDKITINPDTNQLYGPAGVVLLADGVSDVTGGATAKVTVKVPKATVEAHKNEALWVYAKDAANNTVKIAIPLNENIIDVTVPMEANVIAVKKSEAGAAKELLAPELIVTNNSSKKIEVQISGFNTTQTQSNLNLVDKEINAIFQADELALFLKATGNTTFNQTNVMKVGQNPLTLGVLNAAGTAGNTVTYTFDAGYHVNKINVPDGFIVNNLSYHFRIAQ